MGLHTDIAMSLKKLPAVCTEHGNKRDPVDHDSLSDMFLCVGAGGTGGKKVSYCLVVTPSTRYTVVGRLDRQKMSQELAGGQKQRTDKMVMGSVKHSPTLAKPPQ